jgi:hypothetical protein
MYVGLDVPRDAPAKIAHSSHLDVRPRRYRSDRSMDRLTEMHHHSLMLRSLNSSVALHQRIVWAPETER